MNRFFAFLSLFSTLTGSITFNPDRLDVFEENFMYDQAKIVYEQLLQRPVPLDGGIIPPQGQLGYVPLVISNGSGLDASRLYVVGKGQKIEAKDAFFLKPDLNTGICKLVSGQTNNAVDPEIGVQLSSLPTAGPNSYLIYVPQMISGRFYISVDRPLIMQTALNKNTGFYAIDDPSPTTTQDPNYYTIYQNFEFTLDKYYELYANVSNVDFFSIPLQLSSHTFPSGDFYPTFDNITVVGYPLTSKRSSLLEEIKASLKNGDNTIKDWEKLAIPFYKNPYEMNSHLITDLRIIAAKTSIGLEKGNQFKGAKSGPSFFDKDYLQTTFEGPASSISYMEALYDYYKNRSLEITIFPGNLPKATYTLSSDLTASNSDILELKLKEGTGGDGTPSLITVKLKLTPSLVPVPGLTTEDLLAGDVGSWVKNEAFSPNAPDPCQTEISKIISTLFTAGLLPYPDEFPQPLIVDDKFLSKFRSSFFTNPKNTFGDPFQNGPWYNLYDKVIHPFLVQTDGFGLGYAYDYDDLLGLAGLLHVNIQKDDVLNKDQPFAVLSIGPIDTPIPNPTVDFGPYTLKANARASEAYPIEIFYSTTDGSPSEFFPVDNLTPTTRNSVKNFFYVRYYSENSTDSPFLEYIVYPKYQLVLPRKPQFNKIDANLTSGIVFTGTDGDTIEISLPNTKPIFEDQ